MKKVLSMALMAILLTAPSFAVSNQDGQVSSQESEPIDLRGAIEIPPNSVINQISRGKSSSELPGFPERIYGSMIGYKIHSIESTIVGTIGLLLVNFGIILLYKFPYFVYRNIVAKRTIGLWNSFRANISLHYIFVSGVALRGALMTPPSSPDLSPLLYSATILIAIPFAIIKALGIVKNFNSNPSSFSVEEPSHKAKNEPTNGESTNPRASRIILENKLSDDEVNGLYATIQTEIGSGKVDEALWLRFFAESNGDKRKQELLYSKARFAKLQAALIKDRIRRE